MVGCNTSDKKAEPKDNLETIEKVHFSTLINNGTEASPIWCTQDGRYFNGMIYDHWNDTKELAMEQNIKQGKLHGISKSYFKSGVLQFEANFKEGVFDGIGSYKSFFENGNMNQLGNFKNGKKDGLWKIWAENGELLKEVTFINGEEIN